MFKESFCLLLLFVSGTLAIELTQLNTSATLLQGKAPKIRKKLVGLSADENDRIELTAIVDGSPLPNAVWFKNGQGLDSSPPDLQIANIDNKYSLIIEQVKVFLFSIISLTSQG